MQIKQIKNNSVFLLLILSISFSTAQGGWKKKYYLQNSSVSVCRNVIEAPNGNLIMVGLTYDTLNNNSSNRLTLIGTDAIGNMLWRKDYGSQNFEYLDNVVAPKAAIVFDNNFFYHTLGVRDSNNKQVGVLIKFKYNGDTLFQKIYRDPTEDVVPQGITKSVDNGFLLTGFFQNSNTSTCLLIKTDINGNELWRKKINKVAPNVQDGKSIIQDSATKKIIIVGYQYIGPNSDAYSNILILDSLGNKLMQTTFNNAGGGGFVYVTQLKDKNFLTCGGLNANNDAGIWPRCKSLAVKFDINGNMIWNKTYDTLSLFTGISFLHELQNSDIIMGGQLDTMVNYNQPDIVKLRVFRIDKNGNLKWKKYVGSAYTNESTEYFRSMNPTADGGYILAAECHNASNPRPYDIVKIDSTGCDTSEVWCKSVALGIESFYNKTGYSFEMFPIPAKDFVSIKINAPTDKKFKIKINDVTGKELDVFQLEQGDGFDLSISSYKAGVYFANIIYEEKIVETKKLVVIR
jgi:hypothetical protein